MLHGIASALDSSIVYAGLTEKSRQYLAKATDNEPLSYLAFSEELTEEEKRMYPFIDFKHVVTFKWHKGGRGEGVEIFKPLYIYQDNLKIITIDMLNEHIEMCIDEKEKDYV